VGDSLAASRLNELLERCTFPVGRGRVVCGVSGGQDSLALLVLAGLAGCAPTAVYVDHGLRPGTAAEAAAVEAAARELGADFELRRVDVGDGPNLEARAREARHAVLGSDALLGHTADDQAETILLNLMRGAGLEGLAGMRRDGRRPLLDLRRRETREICELTGLVPVEDPTNLDPRFRRNRVRHELLPLLNELAERDVAPLLCRQADLLRNDAAGLAQWAAAIDPTDARVVAGEHPARARWSIRSWLTEAMGGGHPPDAAAVERVRLVAAGDAVATDVGGGWRVRRSGQRLLIEAPVE
jgi:tRNA(Ile)-lysidine synthase